MVFLSLAIIHTAALKLDYSNATAHAVRFLAVVVLPTVVLDPYTRHKPSRFPVV